MRKFDGTSGFSKLSESIHDSYEAGHSSTSISAGIGFLEAKKINDTKKNGGRIICVGTTSCRTVESASTAEGIIHAGCDNTEIFIYPGYQFKVLDALITNFHLPESTLVMLVSALAGREHVLNAYTEAVRERYRFFSFGDAMFVTGDDEKC